MLCLLILINRTNQNRLNDLSINYLGYYTDNGGYYYYYYHTESGINYEATMINVTHRIALPFHYIQLDSWYGIIKHILDQSSRKSLPIGNDSFWIDLFVEEHNWCLIIYEQDFLSIQTIPFLPTITDINLGEQWLMSMGEAAEKFGINIQYCASLPRHILQALKISHVTHTQASDDYALHLKHPAYFQWNIGISSMFADAIGIAPFKDVLWSTSVQNGSSYGPSAMEVLPDREILIATLSTGPVGSGDTINYTNVQRIMKCFRQDGLILKSDRPLTTINILIADWAFYDSVIQGELYSTRTTI